LSDRAAGLWKLLGALLDFCGAAQVASGVCVIPDQLTTSRRRLTADYYPLIARAVAALSHDTREQRDALYERARQALLQQLQSVQPPFSGGEIAAELWALDQAIAQVEKPSPQAEAGRPPQREQPKVATPPDPPVQPRPAAHAADARPKMPVRSGWHPMLKGFLAIYATALLVSGFFALKYPPSGSPPVAEIIFGIVATSAIPLIWFMPALAAWYRRKRCREAGLIKHRVRLFARRNASPDTQRELARQLDDRRLFWCHFLPEHKPQARDIIRDELQRRGYAQQAIETWSPAAADVTVPFPIEGPISHQRNERLIRYRTRYFQFFRGFVLCWVLLIAGLIAFETISSGWSFLRRIEFKPLMATITIPPLVLATIAAVAFRNRVMRVLLLRPFGEKRMTGALKRFVRKNVGRSGNVFTLSDRNYKPNILISLLWRLPLEGVDTLILLFTGPFFGSTKRIASIKRERKFRKLERHLLRKHSPSFWSFMGGNQAFNIRTSDPWWQMCIHMLMHSCEIIVIDLSKVKEGTAWELNQLHTKGILDKCVFVVGEQNVGDVEPVLQRYFPGDTRPTVYVYSDKGQLTDKPAYDTRLNRIMAAELAAWGR
jgi:hypothetical protein